jgi:transposase InsO family protein
MPWSEKSIMDKKLDFIKDYQSGFYTKAELSRRYTISRKTVYKYIKRFEEEGENGLKERSRSPLNRPNTTRSSLINEIIDAKLRFHTWGPKKIIAWLRNQNPAKPYPSPSTAQRWLAYSGLVRHRNRKRKHCVPPYTQPFAECNTSNDVWSIDFKGQFQMGDKRYCYPLTLEDNYSRFLLLCIGFMGTKYEDTRKWLHWAFQEYGLPKVIRSDNGTPFVAPGRTGLSQLSVWFIQLGIKQERTEKGHPEQNGRLERFHRTLKEWINLYPQSNLRTQQHLFHKFKYEYNHERPHEAICFRTPSELYLASTRSYPAKISAPEYGSEMDVRKVRSQGDISLEWMTYFVSQSLSGEYVGLKHVEDDRIEIYYYNQHILTMELNQGRVDGIKRRKHFSSCISKQAIHQPGKKERFKEAFSSSRYAKRSSKPMSKKRMVVKKGAKKRM